MAGAVDGDTERQHAGHLELLELHHRVLDSVGVGTAVVAVVEVLREPVAQENDVLGSRRHVLELLAHVPNSCTHPRRSFGFDRADPRFYLVGKLLVEFLDHVELDVVAAVPGKSHDGVLIAEFFERLRHNHERILVDVDNPARTLRRLRTPLPRLHPVVRIVIVLRMFGRIAMDRLVGRGRHIEQEERGDVTGLLLARLVDTAVGNLAHAAHNARFDGAIDIDLVPVLEPAYHPVRRGPNALEMAAHLRQNLCIALQRQREKVAVVAVHLDLAQASPVACEGFNSPPCSSSLRISSGESGRPPLLLERPPDSILTFWSGSPSPSLASPPSSSLSDCAPSPLARPMRSSRISLAALPSGSCSPASRAAAIRPWSHP